MAKTEPRSAARPMARNRLIAVYAVAVGLYWVALYLYMPTLPVYAESKADNLAMVGGALAMYGLWQAVVRLPLGIVSDWLGRRKVFILVGFALAGLGAYVMGAATSIGGITLGRAITGLAAGTWVPLVVAFSSLFPPEEAVKASALLTFIGSVGRMLATGVTGSLNALGARIWAPASGVADPFAGYPLAFYLAAVAAVLAVLVLLPVREERRPPRKPSVARLGRLLSRGDVLWPSVLSAISQYANWAATFGFFPLIARSLGANDVTVSLMMSMNVGVVTLSNLATTWMVRYVGTRRIIYLSFGLMTLGLLTGATIPSLAMLFFAQVCIGLAQGFGYPVLMGLSIRHVDEVERSSAMGLHQSVYAVGMFAGPWLSGILADSMGIPPMFVITAVAVLIAGTLGARQMSRLEAPAG
jgi:MFS family permease